MTELDALLARIKALGKCTSEFAALYSDAITRDCMRMLPELADRIRSAEAERDELRRCLEASEAFRKAYESGKYQLYAMGGEVCEAAATHLPCSEGPLNRKADFMLGVPGLKAIIRDLTAERDRLRTAHAELDAVTGASKRLIEEIESHD